MPLRNAGFLRNFIHRPLRKLRAEHRVRDRHRRQVVTNWTKASRHDVKLGEVVQCEGHFQAILAQLALVKITSGVVDEDIETFVALLEFFRNVVGISLDREMRKVFKD